jgi:hypothetical protein
MLHYLRAYGLEPFEPLIQSTKSNFDKPAAAEASTFIWKLFHEHKIMPLPTGPTADYNQVYISGNAGFLQGLNGTRGLQASIGNRFTHAVVKMPKGPGGQIPRAHFYDFQGLNARTKSPEDSWNVLAYICGKEHGIRLGLPEGGGSWTCGGRKDVYASEELNKDPNFKIFGELILDAETTFYPVNLRTQQLNDAIKQTMDKIVLNPKQPTSADVKEAHEQIQSVLNEPRG